LLPRPAPATYPADGGLSDEALAPMGASSGAPRQKDGGVGPLAINPSTATGTNGAVASANTAWRGAGSRQTSQNTAQAAAASAGWRGEERRRSAGRPRLWTESSEGIKPARPVSHLMIRIFFSRRRRVLEYLQRFSPPGDLRRSSIS
jgi:hypothetical protein